MTITQEDVARAGVVGAGGAGFPTHVKLSSKADVVILNAAECEPLLHKDKELIRNYASQVVAGLSRAVELVEAKEAVVGVKEKYRDVIAALEAVLPSNMRVKPLPDVYPSGDEFVLVFLTIGRIIAPGAIPISVGAVVINVETAFNLANVGTTPVVDKFVSVAGAVANPCTIRVPLGVTLRECLELAGNATIPNPQYVVGGAMMGRLAVSLDEPVTKTTGGLIVLPEDHFIVQRKQWDWNKTLRVGRAACDQCSRCTELWQFCSECNLCSYCSCPEGLDPRGVNHQNKVRIIAEKNRWVNPPFHPERAELLASFRKTPTTRLMQRIGLNGFVNHGALLNRDYNPTKVTLLLRQHIGAPCAPLVQVGDAVTRGQAIAIRPIKDGKTALGADLHASIDGVVQEITEDRIVVSRS